MPNSRCTNINYLVSWRGEILSHLNESIGIYRLVLTMCRVQYHTRVLSEKTLTLRVTREPNAKTTVFHLTTMSHGVRGIVNFA